MGDQLELALYVKNTDNKKEPTGRPNLKKKAKKPESEGERLYTLEVILTDGPIGRSIAGRSCKISRTIQIRSDQTLDSLHDAIFNAFDREEEHMYEFQFGKRPKSPDNTFYKCATPWDAVFNNEAIDDPDVHDTSVTIGSLGLSVRQTFFYWFDFGDDWWHKIKVLAIEDEFPKRDYPIVTKRVGASPPQYPDCSE